MLINPKTGQVIPEPRREPGAKPRRIAPAALASYREVLTYPPNKGHGGMFSIEQRARFTVEE